MSTSIVKSLTAIRATDAAFSGGKGANLGELVAAGLPVPEGFVLGVPAYRAAAAANPVAGPCAPSGELREAIIASYQHLGDDVAVAVRSSAVAEDSGTASHAGIYETVLNVTGTTHLLDAIGHCWTSASSSPAQRYSAARGLGADEAGMAVVVQRQIASARAGVAFTVDPLTGCPDRLVLECARGPGQAVVAGLVTPTASSSISTHWTS
jgi:pyruvate,water dikinase